MSSVLGMGVGLAFSPLGAGGAFDPSIYAYWFDPSDLDTMKQERTGASATTPAVVDGVVGSFFNKGTAGGWITAASDLARPILRSAGGLYWFELDGVDDAFQFGSGITLVTNMTTIHGRDRPTTGINTWNFCNTSVYAYQDFFWDDNDDVWVQMGDTGVNHDTSDLATGRFVLTTTRDVSTELIRRNGTQLFSRASPTVVGGGVLNTLFETNGFYSTGNYYGTIADLTTLSGAALEAAEAYIAAKSGASIYDPAVNALWFDASDISTMKQERTGASATTAAVVDSPVGSWLNKGTLGGWATCGADAARPILRTTAGLYWLEFDGVDDFMTIGNTFTAGSSAILAAAITRATAGIKSVPTGSLGAPLRGYGAEWYSDNIIYYSLGNSGERTGPASTSTGNFVLLVSHSSGNSQLRRNGVELDSFVDVDATQATSQIGRHSTIDYHAGNIHSIIAAQSIADLADIEAYLAGKSGVVL